MKKLGKCLILAIMVIFALNTSAFAENKPSIKITSASKYGDRKGNAKGKVTGIDTKKYGVAVYIKVRGGWWIKPYWNNTVTKINKSGNWKCDITTGGVDEEATVVAAYLIKKEYNPPIAKGEPEVPQEIENNAVAKAIAIRGCGQEPTKATIMSPKNNETFNLGDDIAFKGKSSSSGSELVWTSNLDGKIGTGASFTKNDLSVGTHTITLKATDSCDVTGKARIKITITTAEPEIKFTAVPAYGSEDSLKGTVDGVKTEDYGVAVYIEVEDVWWTKPTYDSPLTDINTDKSWECDVTTGGNDKYATRIAAFLVPSFSEQTVCGPCYELPNPSDDVASTVADRSLPQKTISFSGYNWKVKRKDFPAGPGPNYFSDSENDIWADNDGMHLTIKNKNGIWYCTEVILDASLGYGTYVFETNSRVDSIDKNMVIGLFTWDKSAYDKSYRELDIEYAKWGNASETTNAQFVVHPCSTCPGCERCTRFNVDLEGKDNHITNYLVWSAGKVEFRTYYGKYDANVMPPLSALAHKWSFTENIPEPGKENARINFWLYGGSAPASEKEIVVSNFVWKEGTPVWNDEPETGIIAGTVKDAETTQPVPNTTISAGKYSALTSTDGSYTITDVDEGSYDVTASAKGYASQTKTGIVVKANETTTCNFDIVKQSPAIEFTSVPAKGSVDNLKGKTTAVDPDSYVVVVYIKVSGGWWGPKPYWASPYTTIKSDGTWECDITTGGYDSTATDIIAFVLPKGYSTPNASGSSSLSSKLYTDALAYTSVTR